MQMPAAGHDVCKRWPAHERGVVPGTAQCLPHAIAKQHHVVSSGQRIGGVKNSLNLAGAQFNFKRCKRQTQSLRRSLHDAKGLISQVHAAFRQHVETGVNQAHIRRHTRPTGTVRVQIRPVLNVFDAVDVKFHLKSANHPQPTLLQRGQGALQHAATVKRHWRTVLKPRLAAQPARSRRPRQHLVAGWVRQQHEVGGTCKAGHVRHAPWLEHFEHRSVGRVFQHQGAHHAHATHQRLDGSGSCQRFAAQCAMHIAPGQAHQVNTTVPDALCSTQHGCVARGTVHATSVRKTVGHPV